MATLMLSKYPSICTTATAVQCTRTAVLIDSLLCHLFSFSLFPFGCILRVTFTHKHQTDDKLSVDGTHSLTHSISHTHAHARNV